MEAGFILDHKKCFSAFQRINGYQCLWLMAVSDSTIAKGLNGTTDG
jgi:hypothetical protein